MSRAPADDVAVLVDGVCKTFRLPLEQVNTLKERVLHPMRRQRYDELHALTDVSFAVGTGEVFGIVGRNGSGKSTLMKCLAGIYQADAGAMWLRGRMAPFIELGVGFNPDLTAHDNVLINAVMLGLTPEQARERYASIMDFAELHEFAELKLKNYSSGMQVRLAFSVMVHVDADLLLIDEVLAVGDAAFQQKCFDVLRRSREEGRTILLVTHDMHQVERFCDRALLLDRGDVVEIGDAAEVGRRYTALNLAPAIDATAYPSLPASVGDEAHIVDAWIQDVEGRSQAVAHGVSVALCMRVRFLRPTRDPVFTVWVVDEHERRIAEMCSAGRDGMGGEFAAGELTTVAISFDNWLVPGRYEMAAQVSCAAPGRLLASLDSASTFVVTGSIPHGFHLSRDPTGEATNIRRVVG